MAIEEEDVGVDPLVEGCLGYHEHASVDQLYNDSEAIRLHTCFHNLQVKTKCRTKKVCGRGGEEAAREKKQGEKF